MHDLTQPIILMLALGAISLTLFGPAKPVLRTAISIYLLGITLVLALVMPPIPSSFAMVAAGWGAGLGVAISVVGIGVRQSDTAVERSQSVSDDERNVRWILLEQSLRLRTIETRLTKLLTLAKMCATCIGECWRIADETAGLECNAGLSTRSGRCANVAGHTISHRSRR